MKTKKEVIKLSKPEMINIVIAQTGLSREKATIAFDTILHYVKNHPGDSLNKMIGYLFGLHDEEKETILN